MGLFHPKDNLEKELNQNNGIDNIMHKTISQDDDDYIPGTE